MAWLHASGRPPHEMDGAHTTDPPVPAADGLDNSAEASHEGAAAPPPTATDGGDASAAAGKMEDGKDSEAARAKCLQQVKQILRDADQHWRAGERIKAIGGYDQAVRRSQHVLQCPAPPSYACLFPCFFCACERPTR